MSHRAGSMRAWHRVPARGLGASVRARRHIRAQASLGFDPSGPMLRDGGRFVVVASSFGSLRYLPEPLHARFDTDRMSLADLEAVLDDYASLVEAGAAAKAGW